GGSGGKIGNEGLPVSGATLEVAQGIEFEHGAIAYPERIENTAAQCDYLDICLRLRDPDNLDADLVELTEAALLRPFVAEHRAVIEELERHALREAVR